MNASNPQNQNPGLDPENPTAARTAAAADFKSDIDTVHTPASTTAADQPDGTDDYKEYLPSFLRNPSKRDIWLYVALMALTIYSFAILPFRAALMVNQPVLYTVLTGSSLTLVTHGATRPEDFGFLGLMILISVISALKFVPIYYLIGRWWGEEFITLSFGNRQPLWWRKLENFIRTHIGWALFLCYIPFSPIPATIVVILAAMKNVSWWKVTGYLVIFIAVVKVFYTYLGIAFDQQVVETLRIVDRYILWITLGLLAWTIFMANRKPKAPKPQV
ncbi:MAG: hypothetical protein Q3976_00125 [Corynebacterium sp.]|nr:hypothetical protein [Corynebacterium sp.]